MDTTLMKKLSRELLGLAGEYAVASELCRRGVYAQLTLGHHKQTDILVETETKMLRIQVKAKQIPEWPGISGLYRSDDFLVFVDFKQKAPGERSDFYVLNVEDWKGLVQNAQGQKPGTLVDDQFRITYADGWRGLNLKVSQVTAAKERWDKILSHIS